MAGGGGPSAPRNAKSGVLVAHFLDNGFGIGNVIGGFAAHHFRFTAGVLGSLGQLLSNVNDGSNSTTIAIIDAALVLVVGAFIFFGSTSTATTPDQQLTQNNAPPAPITEPATPPANEPATAPATPPADAPAANP